MMLVVNMLGSQDCGKSTIAAHVYAELKWAGVNCGLIFGQTFFFEEQYRRLKRLERGVDVVVTDFSLLIQLYSDLNAPLLSIPVLEAYRQFDNMNFLVRRAGAGEEGGARQLDSLIEDALQENGLRYKSLPGVRASVPYIVLKVKERLEK